MIAVNPPQDRSPCDLDLASRLGRSPSTSAPLKLGVKRLDPCMWQFLREATYVSATEATIYGAPSLRSQKNEKNDPYLSLPGHVLDGGRRLLYFIPS